MRPGLKVTGASCNRGYFLASITVKLCSLALELVNVLLLPSIQTAIFIVLAGGYCLVLLSPFFGPRSEFFDFRIFCSAAFRSYFEFLIPMQYWSKIFIVFPEIIRECNIQMNFSRTAYFYTLSD